MEILVASNDASTVGRIRDGLHHLGVECSSLKVISHEAVIAALSSHRAPLPGVVFFCSPAFSPSDTQLLKQVCELAGGRTKVIGVGPMLRPQIILEIIRNGAFDYLDNDRDDGFREGLSSVLHRLVAGRVEASQVGKMFCVLGPAGGAGASFAAINLAAALATPEKPCVLIDLHVRGGDLARLLNATPRYTMASLAGKSAQLDANLFEQALFKHECGIHLLASPDLFGDYRQITPELVQRIVQLARGAAATVVVDLEDIEHAEQIRVVAACDRVVIPLRPDYVSLYRAKKHLEFLLRSKVTPEQVILVANRIGQPRELPLECMEESLGMKIEHRFPNDPLTANTAYNLGVPVVVSHRESPLAQSIGRLARRLSGAAVEASEKHSAVNWTARLRRWSSEVVQALSMRNALSSNGSK